MESLSFFNTLTRSLEIFSPLKPNQVGMYHCGPTVYARAHLGNLVPFIYWDVLRRLLEEHNYEVTQVINFTDIGHIVADADVGNDKMVSTLQKRGLDLTLENLHLIGQEFASTYITDITSLNIKRPHHLPYASQHITENLEIIKRLDEKGLVYKTESGLFFDTQKIDIYDTFKIHGQRSEKGQRIDLNSIKKDSRDFALWKFSDSDIGWDSPWGKGFPGWHIECSAMSWRYLGESFDIHTGGIEHISVHHTNEIAQSEHAFDKPMARYWLHNNHLQLNGSKIAKSDGNVMYLDEIEAEGFSPIDFRWVILTSHYRQEQNLTLESLGAARSARLKIQRIFNLKRTDSVGLQTDWSNNPTYNELLNTLSSDIDTPKTISTIFSKLNTDQLSDQDVAACHYFVENLLGITLDDLVNHESTLIENYPDEIQTLLNQRHEAKSAKNYSESDRLRDELHKLGYVVRDDQGGQKLYKI